MATSVDNMKYMTGLLSIQTISYDKVNQLRHIRFLKDKASTLELMKKHAAIMKPKFEAVLNALDTEIAPLGIAQWKRPKGGYFVSVDTIDGLAKRTLALCKEAGVVMTGAGAPSPMEWIRGIGISGSHPVCRLWRSWRRPCRYFALVCDWQHWKS